MIAISIYKLQKIFSLILCVFVALEFICANPCNL